MAIDDIDRALDAAARGGRVETPIVGTGRRSATTRHANRTSPRWLCPRRAVTDVRLIRSRGDLSLGLVVPTGQSDRMAVIVRLTAVGGGPVQVELTRDDVAHLAADLGVLMSADADTLCRWWYRLSRGDRPGALPQAEVADAC
jgi:hypothetical protein